MISDWNLCGEAYSSGHWDLDRSSALWAQVKQDAGVRFWIVTDQAMLLRFLSLRNRDR